MASGSGREAVTGGRAGDAGVAVRIESSGDSDAGSGAAVSRVRRGLRPGGTAAASAGGRGSDPACDSADGAAPASASPASASPAGAWWSVTGPASGAAAADGSVRRLLRRTGPLASGRGISAPRGHAATPRGPRQDSAMMVGMQPEIEHVDVPGEREADRSARWTVAVMPGPTVMGRHDGRVSAHEARSLAYRTDAGPSSRECHPLTTPGGGNAAGAGASRKERP